MDSDEQMVRRKPARQASGVTVVAVMTAPFACPHGRCTYCPGGPGSVFGDVPQSYTGNEPASMRAIRNHFDPYLQVMNRLETYGFLGRQSGKIELIIMGGTFPALTKEYQEGFVRDALAAMNDFSERYYPQGALDKARFDADFEMSGSLEDTERVKRINASLLARKPENSLAFEQKRNETAAIRCVAMCVETKPDWAMRPHIDVMLAQGVTRVEMGVQALDDSILKRTNRGHTVQESIDATRLLKDAFLKVGYHMMPGQPGSTLEQDEAMLRRLFDDPSLRPDALKIYPCLVMPGTPLFEQWKRGEFAPMSTQTAAGLIARFKPSVPEYCRIMRVQRDIPTKVTAAGPDKTNLRQYVEQEARRLGVVCRCIRCREPRNRPIDADAIKLNVQEYEASGGKEFFISFDDVANDFLLGYCRLRFPAQPWRPEVTPTSAGIRELHVFGDATQIGKAGTLQHTGLGMRLVQEAERIAKEAGKDKMLVISGIGAREYYRKKLGYEPEGPYMSKKI